MDITSRKNSTVQSFRALIRDKKERDTQGCFITEGAKMSLEALNAGIKPLRLLITPDAMKRYPDAFAAIKAKCPVDTINNELSEYISDTKTPQGLFLQLNLLDKSLNFDTIKNSTRLMLLDSLQDSGNIGTIIRTCDALGIDALIMSEQCGDVFSPKTLRSTMGSAFRLPCMSGELGEIIPQLVEAGFTVYAAMLDSTAEKLGSFKFADKSAVVIGNEGNGISESVAALCGKKVFIPMGRAESLNAATAAAILAWEFTKE